MKAKKYLTVLLTLILTACADDYDFANVEIGDNESEVLSIMGEPSTSENHQLPLGFQTKVMTWKNGLNNKVYKAEFVVGKVIDKHITSK